MMDARPKALKKADLTVAQAKAAAAKRGMYLCCLKHPCDWCALKMGSCPCGPSVSQHMPVCNECKGGWAAGDGAIAGKTSDDVTTISRMDLKMGGKTMGTAPAAAPKVIVLKTCPITGEKVVGAGAGMSVVDNYEVHFCCGGCKPMFDRLSKTEQIKKIHTIAGQG